MSYRWDRSGWLESRGYLHRKLLFLDLNFWIRLSEPQNALHEELAGLLSYMVDAGKLLCPVSPSLLMELGKRPRDARREAQSQMMDEFSFGLSLRMPDQTFHDEFKAVLQGRESDRSMAYTHFWDTRSGATAMFQFFTSTSITSFMNTLMGDPAHSGVTVMRHGFSQRTLQEQEWRRQNTVTSQAVEHAEFDGTFRELRPTMLRAISTTYPDGAPDWTTDELIRLLDSCPSFWCSYKMMSEIRLNRPKVTENDVWDFLNVAFAVPYVDCLACDRGTRHLCGNVLGMDNKYGTHIVSQENDLLTWLQGLN